MTELITFTTFREHLLLIDWLLNHVPYLTNMPDSLKIAKELKEVTSKKLKELDQKVKGKSQMTEDQNSRTKFIKDMITSLEESLKFGEKFEALKKNAPQDETMKTHSSPWKNADLMIKEGMLAPDTEYFVRYFDHKGNRRVPKVATWDEDAQCFYPFDQIQNWPIVVNEVMEIPE